MLRSFNRRAQYALPWLPMRSAQEGSAILGGLSGFGTSPERAGRTWDSKSKSLVSISLKHECITLVVTALQPNSNSISTRTSGYKRHQSHPDCETVGKSYSPTPSETF
jgi:hypothetical protein